MLISAMQQAYNTAKNYQPKTMGLAGAGISAASGLIGGLINKIGERKREQRQIEYNKELADYQYSKDLEMWEAQNQYNKPGEQMKRLQEAGLNPNLVYGTGTVTGNTTGQLPKYSSPTTQFKNVPIADPQAMLGQYNQIRQTSAQINQMKALTNLTNKKADTEMFKTMLEGLKGQKLGLDVGHLPQLQKYNLQVKQGIINQQEAQLGLTGKSIENLRLRNAMEDLIYKRAKNDKIYPGDSNVKILLNWLPQILKTMTGGWTQGMGLGSIKK